MTQNRILANRYELIDTIGQGGMALVFKARDLLLYRPVAVKILRDQYSADQEFVERFRREAQAAASLSHPHVVNIYDVGESQGQHFIVMEYVHGRNLKEVIRSEGRLDPDRAAEIAIEIAGALAHAHRQGVVHRDIKPHNILVTSDGHVKVTDFGIARAASSATLTQTGIVIGSVHYFSPEQARGANVGIQSDIYSLGVVLYEMVTGEVPFKGDSPISIALKQIQEDPIIPTRLNPAVPPELERIILKAMHKNPAQRYKSADQLAADLSRYLGRPVSVSAGIAGKPDDGGAGPNGSMLNGGMLNGGMLDGDLLSKGETAGTDDDEPTRAFTPVSSDFEFEGQFQEENELPSKQTRKGNRRIGLYLVFFSFLFLLGLIWAASALPEVIFPEEVSVPDVKGMPVSDAEKILKERGLKLGIEKRLFDPEIPVNNIISQDPAPNRRIKMYRTVWVTVSRGPELVEVPDLLGQDLRQAELSLSQAQLELGTVDYAFDPTARPGEIIVQDPAPGSRLVKDSAVDVVVSKGSETSPTLILPDFSGRDLEQVKTELTGLGLTVGDVWKEYSDKYPPGTVLDQNPAPGSEVRIPQAVSFVVSEAIASGQPSKPETSGPSPGGTLEPEFSSGDSPQQTSGELPAVDEPRGWVERKPGTESQWKEANVKVSVPPGSEKEVVILVVDELGIRQVHRDTHPGGTVITQSVSGKGAEVRIQVYINGELVKDAPI